jgi:hypothetical membrane protein
LAGTMLLGISMLRDPAMRIQGFFGVVIASLGAISWLLPRGDGLALPEILSCLPFFIWMCAMAFQRWREFPTGMPRAARKGALAGEEE